MVNIGDKVRIKQLSDKELDMLGNSDDPSGMIGVVDYIGPKAPPDYPIGVSIPAEDPEDNRIYPDFFAEEELEVVADG